MPLNLQKLSFLLLITGVLCLAVSCGFGSLCSSTGCDYGVSVPTVSGASTIENPDGTVKVTITGSGFVSGTTVIVNGVDCINVIVLSVTQLTCTLPNGSIALVNIVVTSPGSGSSGATTASHMIFVTSVPRSGSLGGLSGADTICKNYAEAGSKTASLSGTWRAILSNDSTDASSRFTFVSGSSIKNTNGETVVSSSSSLWGGSLLAAVQYDENGLLVTPTNSHGDPSYVFTGSNGNGTKIAGKNCNSWGSSVLADGASNGNFQSTSSTWLNYESSIDCKYAIHFPAGRLYCLNSNQ